MKKSKKLFVGVDVGGTKILAALVKANGKIVARRRGSTPRNTTSDEIVSAIVQLIELLLADKKLSAKDVKAIGLGVPGVVDADEGRVVLTPNMNLSEVDLAKQIKAQFRVPVAVGNDVNLGTLGEKWLGAARLADSAVGIFVGTGIGSGIILNGKLLRGSREAAGEIGHITMQFGGPKCGCGARGCLEALASRSAIERDIREAVEAGGKTMLTKLLDGDLKIIRSRMLLQALEQGDALARKVVHRAAEVLGAACLTIRHLVDPEVIVLGGGVIEACGDFILPVVEEAVTSDTIPGARPGGRVVRSLLGDDAVVLGAVAIAQELTGKSPIEKVVRDQREYPTLADSGFGEITVGGRVYKDDVYLRVDGTVRIRNKAAIKKRYGTSHQIGPEELKKICKDHTDVMIIGTGQHGEAALTAEGAAFLRQQGILFESLPTPQAIRQYNRARGAKAALIHVTR